MAPTKGNAVSFDAIIQRGREKQRMEELARDIMGSGRRKRDSGASAPGSLASRMGVTKRISASATSNTRSNTRWRQADNHRQSRNSPLNTAARSIDRYKSHSTSQSKSASDINIRGVAQPASWTVVATNFVPGTTANDIEAVMGAVGGSMLDCKLTSNHPTVIAEMTFAEKSGAEKVISMFNNRKADGRLLYVFMKYDASSPAVPSQRTKYQPRTSTFERDNMDIDRDNIDRPDDRQDHDYRAAGYRHDRRWGDERDEGRLYSDAIRNGHAYRA